MENWLISIAALIVVALLLPLASRGIAKRTGRTRSVPGTWSILVALGTGCIALAAGILLSLPLPWLVFVAGASTGILNLLAQAVAGRRAA